MHVMLWWVGGTVGDLLQAIEWAAHLRGLWRGVREGAFGRHRRELLLLLLAKLYGILDTGHFGDMNPLACAHVIEGIKGKVVNVALEESHGEF